MNRVQMCGNSIASERHPDRNEDSYMMHDNGAIGVFDGLGGHVGSEYASQLAAKYIASILDSSPSDTITPDAAQQYFRETLQQAHELICHVQHLGRRGIACTAVVAQTFNNPDNDKPYVQFTHAGDSRGYLYRHGRFVYTTLDHAASTKDLPLDEQWRIQRHLAQATRRDQIDPYDWRYLYERSAISSCLGLSNNPEISSYSVPVASGDLILLTSDGIHDNLTTREIRSIIGQYGIDAPQHLTQAAQFRSREPRKGYMKIDGEQIEIDYIRPKPDDMTAIVRVIE